MGFEVLRKFLGVLHGVRLLFFWGRGRWWCGVFAKKKFIEFLVFSVFLRGGGGGLESFLRLLGFRGDFTRVFGIEGFRGICYISRRLLLGFWKYWGFRFFFVGCL